MDIKKFAKKYDCTVNDLDAIYYNAFNNAKKFNDYFEDVFLKYLYDSFEQLYFSPSDIESLVSHYYTVMVDYLQSKETENLSNTPIEEEDGISYSSIDSATEGRRKKGYKVLLVNE